MAITFEETVQSVIILVKAKEAAEQKVKDQGQLIDKYRDEINRLNMELREAYKRIPEKPIREMDGHACEVNPDDCKPGRVITPLNHEFMERR